MYWLRVENPLIFLLWLAVAVFWAGGGWLLATHAFRLERGERLIVGFGLGLASYLWFANLLGRFFLPTVTFIGAALLVAALGLAFAWKGTRPILDLRDFSAWRWILLGLVLVWLFARLAKGMAIFDDRKNISIVSTMAAGDIPPHHYMNSAYFFAYHYGFQLLGASLVRLGGLLPWSAFDLSKAMVGAYTLVLVGVFARRYVPHSWAVAGVVTVMAFATGARFLLLLAPSSLLARIDPLIFVRSPDEVVGLSISQALQQGLVLADGPPGPFLYAFMNGIGWPLVMAVHAGPSTFSLALLLLAWLLASRLRQAASIPVLTILFALWAVVWESSYALFLLAGLVGAGYWAWRRRWVECPEIRWSALALVLSLSLALLQGGTLTEKAREVFIAPPATALAAAGESSSLGGFALRWPPAIYSGHLSALSLFSPLELLVAVFELGPVIFFTPWITVWAWRRFRQGDWPLGAAVLSAWLGFILPVFFSYEYDRDIVRFTKHGLVIWTLVLAFMLWQAAPGMGKAFRLAALLSLGLMTFAGLPIFATELTAATQTVLTEDGITGLDARLAREVWDRLPRGSLVFDPQTWRATMLTGRLTRVVSGNMSYDYEHSAEWEALRLEPSIPAFLAAGFDYVYIDEAWWNGLPATSRAALSAPCTRVLAEQMGGDGVQFRRLVSLEDCAP
ncbi:MAG TPA: hypothetical protein VJ436_02290 [Anaerolineales bacterium]|nr:hypothetical protein [Anaerolineales bacterium]